jgi:hypothetical protein
VRLIAHRANLRGPSPATENSPDAIHNALAQGYEVEVDLRVVMGRFLLGHDAGVHEVDPSFMQQPGLLIHCKNYSALRTMKGTQANYFWHTDDAYTLTSHGDILINPKSPPMDCGILLMPELSKFPRTSILACAGICSDTPDAYV